MGEVVNLRLQRKRAARRAADAAADENRIAHGLPKAVREIAGRRTAQDMARLDGRRLTSKSNVAKTAVSADATPSVVSDRDDDH
ncbi:MULTISPECIES: DUF4169 family protein [unclassified Aureimonas]|uniref:DUF4169 family protein n=1 Tax=unclassified Aureimonas TaxID=2615206 RepID=UPI000700996D|nr:MULTISPECIES: DUF4169 family protein [unclassified Aureimonas]KQT52867.1 hypothetical protein ASG62_13175 [Aureimonas sp. Leaf427]KQT80326.1 hypothetical protein ASG54_07025 [Aureimonas sp. Leaf460]